MAPSATCSGSTNRPLELAFNYVAHTHRNVFLTGKAGTGKTTFLHRVRREVPKQIAVVAPTGVAAINAGAQTIHSLFSLPLGFIPPGRIRRQRRISNRKVNTLRAIDLLIIDEISMVRADVLDAMDGTLRSVRRNERPFGGVQVLMIGDLHQLPPVVTSSEASVVGKHYQTPYYFGARVLTGADMVSISLTHIFRQRDATFIHLLNKVRNNEMTDGVLAALNARYQPHFRGAGDPGYITLTSHNVTARRLNNRRLAEQPGTEHTFEAKITGTFPPSMYPNEPTLRFKIGAQVMFNRNDTTGGLYYNGKIGRIVDVKDGVISVHCAGEKAAIQVEPITWENVRYDAEGKAGAVCEKPIGRYTQHPLRLAYAITIHKSQGLTFEKVVIDAADSFTHGQVYVALSRCKTLEGVVLTSRLRRESVRTDRRVAEHSRYTDEHQPTAEQLKEDRRRYGFTCLEQLFDFTALQRQANEIAQLLNGPLTVIQGNGVRAFMELREALQRAFIGPGAAFQPALRRYAREQRDPESDEPLQTRLQTAGRYYTGHFTGEVGRRLADYNFLTDNSTLRGRLDAELQLFRLGYYLKQRCFEQLTNGFATSDYANARQRAREEFARLAKPSITGQRPNPGRITGADSAHPALYEELQTWRYRKADELDTQAYRILHNSVLIDLCDTLPVTERALLKISKVGPKTVEKYGADVLRIIKTYALRNGLAGNQLAEARRLSGVKDDALRALGELRAGVPIEEVRKRWKRKLPALYAEAAKWVRDGRLTPAHLLAPERLAALRAFCAGYTLREIGVLVARAEGKFTVGELRLVLMDDQPETVGEKEVA